MKKTLLLSALAALAVAHPVQADQIELNNGKVIHGEILGGKCTDEALALKLFETGGELMIDWEHVLPERRKKLRIDLGLELEEQDVIEVDGHELTSRSGETILGLLLNPDSTSGPWQLKTTNSVKEYPRDAIAKVSPSPVDIALVYTPREAYEKKLAETPPQDARGHFELGVFASNVGDHEMAKKHFDEAATDTEFAATDDGRSLPQRQNNAAIMITAKGAQDMVKSIRLAMSRDKWNDARDEFLKMKEDVTDERVLKAVRAEQLERSIVRGREDYFTKKVQTQTYREMRDLIRAQVRIKKKKSLGDDPRDGAAQGTLAASKQWCARELPQLLFDAVSSKLGLELEEVNSFWEKRKLRQPQSASYGSGTFIVSRADLPKAQKRRRRPPGSRNRGDRGGGNNNREEKKPLTEEEWWEQQSDSVQSQWLTAYFVESSGIFQIIRQDDSEKCGHCSGVGYTTITSAGGGTEHNHCLQCNGAGMERRVSFR